MDGSLIENWESGITEPTITECMVLSKLYGVCLDDMFEDFSVRSLIPEDCTEFFDRKTMENTKKAVDFFRFWQAQNR